MKLALASLLIGSAAAFSSPSFVARTSAMHMSTEAASEVYSFAKSEEIFAEAQEVRCYAL